MNVRLVSITAPYEGAGPSTPEELIAYCARVSSPANQDNHATGPRLLAYLIRQRHWSPFEMVDMTVEIETSRAIAAQILRHRSFSFQEFSQRYAVAGGAAGLGYEPTMPRKPAEKNRQSSVDVVEPEHQRWWALTERQLAEAAAKAYDEALERGIAKECARMLLPLSTRTRIYMKGSVRSWVHYLELRCAPDTQQEHREVAEAIRSLFVANFPETAGALGWSSP